MPEERPEERKVIAPSPRPIEGREPGRRTASGEKDRAVLIKRVILVGIVVVISLIALDLPYLHIRLWQMSADIGGLVLGLVCLTLARWSVHRGKLDAAGYWILFTLVIIYGAGELVWANETLYNAIGGVSLIFLVGSIVLPRKWGAWLVTAGLYTTGIFLVNQFEPLPRHDAITEITELLLFNLGLTVLLVLAALWQVSRTFRAGTIRTRLIITFVLMVLLPAAAISSVSAALGFSSGQQRAIEQLELAASFKETEINDWADDLQTGLNTALTEKNTLLFARVIFGWRLEPTPNIYNNLKMRFSQYIEQTQRFEELFLLNLEGEVVASTDETRAGELHGDQPYFQEGLKAPYASCYSPAPDQVRVIAVQPVLDEEGETLGVVAGYANMGALDEVMSKRIRLGESGKIYLVSRDRISLTEPRRSDVRTKGVNAALETQDAGHGLYTDYRGEPVVGVYHWLPQLQVALLAEQDQTEAFRAIYSTLGINVGVALVSVVLAVIASLFITRSIANPMAELAELATQIAAGDLGHVAKVEREDEIGALAQAFNSMTAQLRDLIGTLEQRVADRTLELEQRSAYLEASAEVGRAAVSILEVDRLIQQTVELIRERFGLYYVGLFLVDRAKEWAVLRSGTGEAGRAMLARGHRIKIGAGMIGWSVAQAEARVALEAGTDAVRLATAELPHTRSEAALPLRSRGQVLGALTVQHTMPGAFDEATIAVLQTMADQVAVALDNARLFTDAQAALETARRAYGELSYDAWRELLRAQPDLSYRGDEYGVASAGDVWRPEMERALQEERTVHSDGAGSGERRPLAVPIKVRGNVIGVLDTYKPGAAGDWTLEEIALLETLTDQLGVALESARLYDDAQRRAAREQMTREITDKMRRAASVEDVVQTAVDELYRVLGTSRTFVRLGTVPSQDGATGNEQDRSERVEQ